MIKHGFNRGRVDGTPSIRKIGKQLLIVQIYVDDIVVGETFDSLWYEFACEIKSEFEISMIGELSFFLGIQVKQTTERILISQSKYTQDLIKRFVMEGKNHARMPMSTIIKIYTDPIGKSIDPTLYKSMVGSLLYITTSRPDITFSVSVYARFQANPKESHTTAIKRILKYLSVTIDYEIWYSKDTNLSIVCYSDADWARSADDRKITSCECFYVWGNLVAWMNKKKKLNFSIHYRSQVYRNWKQLLTTFINKKIAWKIWFFSRLLDHLLWQF